MASHQIWIPDQHLTEPRRSPFFQSAHAATEAVTLGKPDLALMSKTDRLAIARNIVKAVDREEEAVRSG